MKKVTLLLTVLVCGLGCANADSYHRAIEAIKARDNSALTEVIKDIPSIDSLVVFIEGEDPCSMLGYACLFGNREAVAQLIDMGAHTDDVYTDGIYLYDALYVAVNSRDTCIVKLLVDNGANVNAVYNENGLTPLCVACREGEYAIAKMLIAKGANVNGAGDCGGDHILFPFLISAEKGDRDMMNLLVASGADIKVKDKQGLGLNDYLPEELKHNFIDNGRLSDQWRGTYSLEMDYGQMDESSRAAVGYSIIIKDNSAEFAGAGNQTFFDWRCSIVQKGDTLCLCYIETTDGTKFDGRVGDIVARIMCDNDGYYMASPLISDKEGRANVKLLLHKDRKE